MPKRIMSFQLKVILIYILLIAGGLWHILGVFQPLMRTLSGPILIALALFQFYELYRLRVSKRFWMWCLVIGSGGFIAEVIGVKCGLIFGHYQYGDILKPAIAGVPLAIGFAWITIILSSLAAAQILFPRNAGFAGALTLFLTVLFDVFMEPAATRLSYWSWHNHVVPLQNYLAWFLITLAFLIIGSGLRIFRIKLPAIYIHLYLAQLFYFLLVALAH